MVSAGTQLAGGTNDASARLMAEAGLLRAPRVGGIAVGGYARKIVGGVLDELQSRSVESLEDEADLLAEAMAIAGKSSQVQSVTDMLASGVRSDQEEV